MTLCTILSLGLCSFFVFSIGVWNSGGPRLGELKRFIFQF